MNENVVAVTSMSSCLVTLVLPEFHYSRTWPKKGAKIYVDKEILKASIYKPGVERLFTEGFLYIDDANFRIELGLEDAPIEENSDDYKRKELMVLDDKLINRILKLMPAVDATETIKKLSENQKLELVDYAVAHYTDLKMDRVELLSKFCGIDILKSVEMKKALEEE